ncbi:MAG: DUF2797 domain-containing protein [Candidatus Methanomethylophilaceae archaeon]
MFRDASQLMEEEPEACFRWHAVDFRWDGFVPRLTVRDNNSQETSFLPLDEWRWFVSELRRCPGSRTEEHPRCPHDAPLQRFSRCQDCDSFPRQECVFEPRCDGSSCQEAVCGQPHVVYISFFGRNPKVGMTRLERIRSRGIEQGADAIMPVMACRNRLEAREEEKRLSAAMGVRQTVGARDFARSLMRCPPYEDITVMAEGMLRDNDLEDHGLMMLDGYPMPVLERAPLPVPTPGRHRGHILGLKGRFLVYRDLTGQPKMMDASDLVSRFLGTAPSRCGQTTLF